MIRPQPLGIFPLPAGLLLLPRGASRAVLDGDAAAAGEAFFVHAVEGRPEQAAAALGHAADLVSVYNRFVLTGEPALYQALVRCGQPPLAALAAGVAYTLGLADEPPSADGFDGEFAAMLSMLEATHSLEHDRPAEAVRHLEHAIACARPVSPLFAAQLLSQKAQILRAQPGLTGAMAPGDLEEALHLAAAATLPRLRADLHYQLGLTFHELARGQRGALLEAVRHYQNAIHAGFDRDSSPEQFAMIQNNIGLAWLAMPMTDASDQLRMGAAVLSFREALTIYTESTHPELWTSVQLNLANALQYLPSSHPQENLIQAVEIYEQLLSHRNRALDPLGYARLLSNQANALAHLGMFAPALEKYNEAYKLFHWHGEPHLAESVLEMVALINQQMSSRPEPAPVGA